MDTDSKLIPFSEASDLFDRLRAEDKVIVQSHGTFDLLHPGHLVHFEEAKSLGDVLVVTITAEKDVNKGPGRPFFNDDLRSKALAALECVDYVVVIPYAAAVEAITCVKPNVYCKGTEYEDPEVDVTGNIYDDLKTVTKFGGTVAYVGSVVFSSSRLLNRHFETHSPKVKAFCGRIANDYPADRFLEIVEGFSKLRVLVVGDIIFDRYSTLNVQGLTSKNRMLSGRFVREETQAGGALAVFRHVREFTPNVKLLSLVGTELWTEETLSQFVHPYEDEVMRIPEFTTVVKQRFVEPISEGKELSKLFSVNFIDGEHPNEDVQRYVCERLSEQIEGYDLILVMDFGHGLMQGPVRELVQKRAPFLALNCQTNSNNHGFNLINRQYHRADSFSLDQTELNLACGMRHYDAESELRALHSLLGSTYSWLTRGSVETIGLKRDEDSCMCEPLEHEVVDTIGAGDAFCSLASMAAVRGLPVDLATFMGQLAGAIAVRIVGNSESIKKSQYLKSAEAMLRF